MGFPAFFPTGARLPGHGHPTLGILREGPGRCFYTPTPVSMQMKGCLAPPPPRPCHFRVTLATQAWPMLRSWEARVCVRVSPWGPSSAPSPGALAASCPCPGRPSRGPDFPAPSVSAGRVAGARQQLRREGQSLLFSVSVAWTRFSVYVCSVILS